MTTPPRRKKLRLCSKHTTSRADDVRGEESAGLPRRSLCGATLLLTLDTSITLIPFLPWSEYKPRRREFINAYWDVIGSFETIWRSERRPECSPFGLVRLLEVPQVTDASSTGAPPACCWDGVSQGIFTFNMRSPNPKKPTSGGLIMQATAHPECSTSDLSWSQVQVVPSKFPPDVYMHSTACSPGSLQVGSIAGEWTRVVARFCVGDAEHSLKTTLESKGFFGEVTWLKPTGLICRLLPSRETPSAVSRCQFLFSLYWVERPVKVPWGHTWCSRSLIVKV